MASINPEQVKGLLEAGKKGVEIVKAGKDSLQKGKSEKDMTKEIEAEVLWAQHRNASSDINMMVQGQPGYQMPKLAKQELKERIKAEKAEEGFFKRGGGAAPAGDSPEFQQARKKVKWITLILIIACGLFALLEPMPILKWVFVFAAAALFAAEPYFEYHLIEKIKKLQKPEVLEVFVKGLLLSPILFIHSL